MKSHTLFSVAAILGASGGGNYYQDVTVSPEPWARGTAYKGSGTGCTGLNVTKSRAKAKAARKARKKHKAGAK